MKKKTAVKKIIAEVIAVLFLIGTLEGCGSVADASNSNTALQDQQVPSVSGSSETAENQTANREGSNSEVRTIKIGTSGGPSPFIWQNKDGSFDGYDIAVFNEIGRRLPQYKFEYELQNFSDIFASVDSGYLQGIVQHLGINDERQEKYLFSDVYSISYNGVLVRNDWADSLSIGDFAGKKTELSPGSFYASFFENYNKNNPDKKVDIVYSDNNDTASHVQDGTIDFELFNKSSLEYQIKDKGLKGVKVAEYDDSENKGNDGTYFLFSKDEKQLRDDVNTAFEAAVKDGTIAKIAEKYQGGTEYAPTIEQIEEERKNHNIQ